MSFIVGASLFLWSLSSEGDGSQYLCLWGAGALNSLTSNFFTPIVARRDRDFLGERWHSVVTLAAQIDNGRNQESEGSIGRVELSGEVDFVAGHAAFLHHLDQGLGFFECGFFRLFEGGHGHLDLDVPRWRGAERGSGHGRKFHGVSIVVRADSLDHLKRTRRDYPKFRFGKHRVKIYDGAPDPVRGRALKRDGVDGCLGVKFRRGYAGTI